MKRPSTVSLVIGVHVLATLALIGLILYLLWLTRSPEILAENDAASAIQGLKIGAMVLAIPSALWIPGLWAMWKRRSWGWWLTLITGVGTASVLVYSMIDDGWKSLDPEDAAFTAAIVILPVSLLLPQVRKYYRRSQPSSSPDLPAVHEITPTTP